MRQSDIIQLKKMRKKEYLKVEDLEIELWKKAFSKFRCYTTKIEIIQ